MTDEPIPLVPCNTISSLGFFFLTVVDGMIIISRNVAQTSCIFVCPHHATHDLVIHTHLLHTESPMERILQHAKVRKPNRFLAVLGRNSTHIFEKTFVWGYREIGEHIAHKHINKVAILKYSKHSWRMFISLFYMDVAC